jgi:hypothetical protein
MGFFVWSCADEAKFEVTQSVLDQMIVEFLSQEIKMPPRYC